MCYRPKRFMHLYAVNFFSVLFKSRMTPPQQQCFQPAGGWVGGWGIKRERDTHTNTRQSPGRLKKNQLTMQKNNRLHKNRTY